MLERVGRGERVAEQERMRERRYRFPGGGWWGIDDRIASTPAEPITRLNLRSPLSFSLRHLSPLIVSLFFSKHRLFILHRPPCIRFHSFHFFSLSLSRTFFFLRDPRRLRLKIWSLLAKKRTTRSTNRNVLSEIRKIHERRIDEESFENEESSRMYYKTNRRVRRFEMSFLAGLLSRETEKIKMWKSRGMLMNPSGVLGRWRKDSELKSRRRNCVWKWKN